MIGYLKGRLLSKEPSLAVIDVNGVGYEIEIPVSTYYDLGAAGSEAQLHIHTHVRADAIVLFGFTSLGERSLFKRLISISGVGPKTALLILGGMGPADLLAAVEADDFRKIVQVPGIGKKTAERLVLELRDKLPELKAELDIEISVTGIAGTLKQDVVSALVNLGYKRKYAQEVADQAIRSAPDEHDFGVVLRSALALLTK